MEDGRQVSRKMTDSIKVGWMHVLSRSKQDFYQRLWFCEKDPPPRRFDPDSKFIFPTVTRVTNGGISGERTLQIGIRD
jgi:hypothetical protein